MWGRRSHLPCRCSTRKSLRMISLTSNWLRLSESKITLISRIMSAVAPPPVRHPLAPALPQEQT